MIEYYNEYIDSGNRENLDLYLHTFSLDFKEYSTSFGGKKVTEMILVDTDNDITVSHKHYVEREWNSAQLKLIKKDVFKQLNYKFEEMKRLIVQKQLKNELVSLIVSNMDIEKAVKDALNKLHAK